MVTLETLQIINAERHGHQFNIETKNLKLNNVRVVREVKAEPVAELIAEQENIENSPEAISNNTEHIKIFNDIIHVYSLILRAFGLEMSLYWNWKKSPKFLLNAFLLLLAYTSMLYTSHIHYTNGNYARIIEPLVISGISISCGQNLNAYINYWEASFALILNSRFLCRLTAESTSRANVLKAGFRRTYTLMKIFAAGFSVSASFYLTIPLMYFLVHNELLPLIPMEVPFCNQSTTSGFVAANVMMASMGGSGTACTVVYGLTFIIIISSYTVGVDLLAEDFKDLDKMWTGQMKVSVAYRHAFLRNICRKRQDMNCYLKWIKKIYGPKLFYYFCANYFSQIIGLYQITINDWISGYGPLIALFLEMMFYCYMGTQISKSSDRLCYVIYDTCWYEYDLLSQRTILMLLHEAQADRDIRLGFIGKLNLMTFIQIVKSIYTYYTVLKEVM